MKIVAEKNDFEYGVDVKMLTVGNSYNLKDYLNQNKNTTQYAVLFCAEEEWKERVTMDTMGFSVSNESEEAGTTAKPIEIDFYMPCKFEHYQQKELMFYTLIYNISL